MRMFRIQCGASDDQAWFTADSAEEAATLSGAAVLHECHPGSYPEGITVKGVAAIRLTALTVKDILDPTYRKPEFRTWVITSEHGSTQEIQERIDGRS